MVLILEELGMHMKKIIFLYHVKEREYQIIEMIKSQILISLPCADIRIGEFYKSVEDVADFNPDVIVSIPPRDCYSANYLTTLKLLTGAVVISMTTEGYHNFDERALQSRIGHNAYSKKLVDYYIMWGPKTGRLLGQRMLETKKLTDMRRVKITGYAFYELEKAKEALANPPSYEKVMDWARRFERICLVLTGFMVGEYTVKDWFLEGEFGDQKSIKSIKQVSQEQIERAKGKTEERFRFRERYIGDVELAAQRMPDRGFIVKLHPTEVNGKVRYYDRLAAYPNIFVMNFVFPVSALFPAVDVMVHYGSTTCMEAYIHGVPTILRHDDGIADFADISRESTYCYSLDERERFIAQLEQGCSFRRLPQTEKKLYELFNWKRGMPYTPVEKTAAIIANAKKPQHISCFEEAAAEAVTSGEGKVIESHIFWSLLRGEWEQGALRGIFALLKLQFVKIIGAVRRRL